jgi:hypothetical protein
MATSGQAATSALLTDLKIELRQLVSSLTL